MAENNQENFWAAGSVGQSPNTEDSSPSIPEPPHEVRIRTMQSDIESMVASGGSGPRFKSVKVATVRPVQTEETNGPAGGIKKNSFLIPLITLIAIGAIGAGAFLFYNILPPPGGSTGAPATIQKQDQAGQPAQQQTGANQSVTAAGSTIHQSFFKKSADKTLVLVIRSTAQSSFDLQTYSQKLLGILPSTSTGGFFEVNAEDEKGNNYEAIQLLNYADVALLDPAYLFAHFNTDATMFVYKDKNGSWPGYILQLKPTENWLFLKDDVAKIEQSSQVPGFFLTSPGNADTNGFKDITLSGQPARELTFSSPGAAFVYGWYNGYLIMSASESGFNEAISRL
ncbi:MAG: hypothetical protein KGJ89_00995 [Patescibacteria group bacterium]|nr:hypothetical protein [Patescibacteria group bacterium]MDE2015090.1 hypothetical protein [Patescibacteria group bacterium]MDE2226518.1 hypothetical protein [Patescibacteria group bacterium]